jgi:predicted transcriptional regulator
MIDLIRALSSEHIFAIVDYVKKNPGQNASAIAAALNIHPVTVQRPLETLAKYGFVSVEERRSVGRPSHNYTYLGGSLTIDLDKLFSDFALKDRLVRESGHPDISFSYDVDRETVGAVLVGGKSGRKIKLDSYAGRFLWLVPPPDSEGKTVEQIGREAGLPPGEAIRAFLEFQELGVVEVIR